MRLYKNLRQLFGGREMLLVIAMMVIAALAEAVGLMSILPFVEVLAEPKKLHEHAYLSFVFDFFNFDEEKSKLIALAVFVLLILLASSLIKVLSSYITMKFVQSSGAKLSSRIFKLYLNQRYEWHLNREPSQLTKVIFSEAQLVIGSGLLPLLNMISSIILVIVISGVLIFNEPVVIGITFGVIGLSYLIIFSSIKPVVDRLSRRRSVANSGQFKLVKESFDGVKEIRLMLLAQSVISKFEINAHLVASSKYLSHTLKIIPRYLIEFITFSLIIILCLTLFLNGGLSQTLPVITLFAVAFYRLLPAIQQLYQAFVDSQFISPAVDAVVDALALDYMEQAESSSKLAFRYNIEFCEIDFRYAQNEADILHNISFEIKKGDFLGIIGDSGTGKSTLLNLLSGLLAPTSGKVLIDGTTLERSLFSRWCKNIGYVHQHSFLFDGTILQNVTLGDEFTDIDRVRRALKCAGLADFVFGVLPDGVNSIVGEQGALLSGGQRQRVCIARALYKQPDLLILDEATNALDEKTQRKVLSNLHKLYPDLTVVFVTHRREALGFCNQIIEL